MVKHYQNCVLLSSARRNKGRDRKLKLILRVSADEQGGKTALISLALKGGEIQEMSIQGCHCHASYQHKMEKKAKVATETLMKNLQFYLLYPSLIFLSSSFLLFSSDIVSQTAGFGLWNGQFGMQGCSVLGMNVDESNKVELFTTAPYFNRLILPSLCSMLLLRCTTIRLNSYVTRCKFVQGLQVAEPCWNQRREHSL